MNRAGLTQRIGFNNALNEYRKERAMNGFLTTNTLTSNNEQNA